MSSRRPSSFVSIAAVFNVEINLGSIKDEDLVQRVRDELTPQGEMISRIRQEIAGKMRSK